MDVRLVEGKFIGVYCLTYFFVTQTLFLQDLEQQ